MASRSLQARPTALEARLAPLRPGMSPAQCERLSRVDQRLVHLLDEADSPGALGTFSDEFLRRVHERVLAAADSRPIYQKRPLHELSVQQIVKLRARPK